MKRSLFFLALCAFPAFAEDLTPRIREGVRLHDAGKYAEAIAVYDEVLANEPSNGFAAYRGAGAWAKKNQAVLDRSSVAPQ